MQKNINIARSYATAIFHFAVKKKSLKYWKDFLNLLCQICQDKKIHAFFFDIYSEKIVFSILHLCLNKFLNQYSENFIKLLILYKRLNLIPYILEIFLNLYNKHYNIINVHIISAIHITKKKKKKILLVLQKKLNKIVHLKTRCQPSILSGLILKKNDLIISNCILHRFKALSNFLLS